MEIGATGRAEVTSGAWRGMREGGRRSERFWFRRDRLEHSCCCLVASCRIDDNNQIAPSGRIRLPAPSGGLARRQKETIKMAGYSGTPLAKKLGIKPGTILYLDGAPAGYVALLAPLPDDVRIATSTVHGLDVVHLFTKSRSDLLERLNRYKCKIKQDGAIWVSWPKKASGIPSEVSENTVRELALPLGLVDIKVCAVDDVWSGLKLVIRKENRK
jgi:hypothetical protein